MNNYPNTFIQKRKWETKTREFQTTPSKTIKLKDHISTGKQRSCHQR